MNFLTMQQEVASTLRLDNTVASQNTLIMRWLNMSGKEIWAENDWIWAQDRQIVQTVVDKTAGTVTINPSATTVTGTSTAFASTDVGSYIQFSQSNDWYKITAVASGTSLTIEVAFVSTTALTAGTYTIRKVFYSLGSNVEKVLTARQAISPSYMSVTHYREFDMFRPNPTTTGNPISMFLYGLDSNNNMQFTPWPWPSAVENLEIRIKKNYTDLVNNTDTSLIPAKWHETVMIDGALWRGYQYMATDTKDYQARAMLVYQRFRAGIANMKAQYQPDESSHTVIDNRDIPAVPFGPILPFKYGV